MGIGQTINPIPPVLVARHDDNAAGASYVASESIGGSLGAPTVSLVSDGPPGTMPDLRGMSARDALRRMMRLGLAARVDGSGFVVSQDPPAGASLDAVSAGRVTLARRPVDRQEQARP